MGYGSLDDVLDRKHLARIRAFPVCRRLAVPQVVKILRDSGNWGI